MFLWLFLNKGFILEGRGVAFLKMQKKKKRGRGGQTYPYILSVKKITWFFKQQIEFFLIAWLLKIFFIKRAYTFF